MSAGELVHGVYSSALLNLEHSFNTIKYDYILLQCVRFELNVSIFAANICDNKADKERTAEWMMQICSQLELVPSIFSEMVNIPQATSDLQPIDTAPSTMSWKNSAAESIDIYQIREYSTLSIGLRFNNISLLRYLLANLESF